MAVITAIKMEILLGFKKASFTKAVFLSSVHAMSVVVVVVKLTTATLYIYHRAPSPNVLMRAKLAAVTAW